MASPFGRSSAASGVSTVSYSAAPRASSSSSSSSAAPAAPQGPAKVNMAALMDELLFMQTVREKEERSEKREKESSGFSVSFLSYRIYLSLPFSVSSKISSLF